MQRAEAVKAYLYEQHKIPLHRMNVISYGEDKPVEKNNTSKGRAHEPPRRHPRARAKRPARHR